MPICYKQKYLQLKALVQLLLIAIRNQYEFDNMNEIKQIKEFFKNESK